MLPIPEPLLVACQVAVAPFLVPDVFAPPLLVVPDVFAPPLLVVPDLSELQCIALLADDGGFFIHGSDGNIILARW
jgi:hypothetical protein